MIRFGTLGVARITTRALINPCIDEPRATVVAIAARDRQRADRYAEFAHIPVVLDSYQAVIERDDVNAIYVPLPITAHREWTIKALQAGKHVLCEKSFAANERDAAQMAAAARQTGKVLMDAFHYRYHPLFVRAKEIYDSGVLGEVRSIDAAFHIPGNGIKADDIRMNYATGGGVTMDIGCYPISWVRHITAAEPTEISANAVTGPRDVDVFLEAQMKFPGGIVAKTSGDMRRDIAFKAAMTVSGTDGSMVVVNPLVPQTGNRIILTLGGESRTETFDRRPTYSYQLDAFIAAVTDGAALFTDADDAVRQMHVIDACYRAAGLPLRGQ
jgi:predicted dehydrogenase